MKKIVLCLIILLAWQYIIADQVNPQVPDTLSAKSCEYLSHAFDINKKDTVKSLVYAHAWLKNAKAIDDWSQVALAYKALMHNGRKEQRVGYANDMIAAARHTSDTALIGSSYLTMGILYYSMEEHTKALDNYIIADEYISKTYDRYLIHKLKYSIALTKMYLGFYDESLSILKECVDFYHNQNDIAYLRSLHALGMCYNRLGKYNLCTEVNQKGIAFSDEVGDAAIVPYFMHSEGVNNYFKKDYKSAIKILSATLGKFNTVNERATRTVAYFYLGESYWALGDRSKAIMYLKKVDDAFTQHGYSRPELRVTYELLIDYYKQKKNKELQLFYINRLLEVDKLLNRNYKYLSGRIMKEYDTKDLLRARKDLEHAMSIRKAIDMAIIAALSCIVVLVIWLYSRTKKRYKRKFEEWRNHSNAPPTETGLKEPEKDSELDINPELEATVLKNLEKFEAQRRYTEKDMSLVRMASILQANPKYVSKIIQRSRGKKFTDYMNEIRIRYIIEMLDKESRWRNYTNQALAREAGFGSTQNFTRAFNNKMGMPPTFFIQELKKEINAKDLN